MMAAEDQRRVVDASANQDESGLGLGLEVEDSPAFHDGSVPHGVLGPSRSIHHRERRFPLQRDVVHWQAVSNGDGGSEDRMTSDDALPSSAERLDVERRSDPEN